MFAKSYRDLRMWQEAHALALDVFRVTAGFPPHDKFVITQQVRRAASSVSANIVEGFNRFGRKEQKNFLAIARASAAETEYFLELSQELGYLDKSACEIMVRRYEGLKAAIFAFGNKRPTDR